LVTQEFAVMGVSAENQLRPLSSMWNSIKKLASSKSQQGEPELEAVVDEVEHAGEAMPRRMSQQKLEAIQRTFGDDEQLMSMLSQLTEAPPEEYAQILNNIEEHIARKVGMMGGNF